MHATEILTNEHRVIEQVLNCIAELIDRGESTGRFDWTSAEQIIGFLRNFADGCHHAKEEEQLFPALEQRGFSPELGPTAVMRSEHEEGRRHIAAMAAAVDASLRGDNGWALQFAEHSRAYIELLRQHIQKEDHCLFPMADRVLSELDQQHVLSAFGDIEAAPARAGQHEHYLKLANTLADQFDVPHAVTSAAHPLVCCGHDA